MARPRRQTTTNERNERMAAVDTSAFMDVSDEDLEKELAGGRARGIYDENLRAFFQTGRRGVRINLEEGPHAAKKAQSVKTGYETARVKIADGKNPNASESDVEAAANTTVHAKTNPDRVFLTRKDVERAAA